MNTNEYHILHINYILESIYTHTHTPPHTPTYTK